MMKKTTLIIAVLFTFSQVVAQTKSRPLALSLGASINHYNGNLGNSFFQFKTTCFTSGVLNLDYYLNRSFDLKISSSYGDFGYCQTEADASRIVPAEIRCPGCAGRPGMGDLRSRMISGNLAVAYKFANGYLLSENSVLSPYVYSGAGIAHLSDVMKKNCVNKGYHFSLNAGAGVKCRINKTLSVGYDMGLSCFPGEKVYASNVEGNRSEHSVEIKQFEKKKDMLMQNTLFVSINL